MNFYKSMKHYIITETDAAAIDQAIDTLREIVKAEGTNTDKDVLKVFQLLAPIVPIDTKGKLPYACQK